MPLALLMSGCERPAPSNHAEGPECAVYAEVLEYLGSEFVSVDYPLPLLMVPVATTSHATTFPEWDRWMPVDGQTMSSDAPIEWVAFEPLNAPGQIACNFDVHDWRWTRADGDLVGWLFAPLERTTISAGTVAELSFSPVYLSPNGQRAVLQIDVLRLSSDAVHRPLGEVLHQSWNAWAFLLERNATDEWVVIASRW